MLPAGIKLDNLMKLEWTIVCDSKDGRLENL